MRRDPLKVAIPVFPECDPSIVYGVFDTLWGAGRLWNSLHGGRTGEPLFEPRLVGREAGPLALVTGVTIVVQEAVASTDRPDIVLVPNVMVDTPESLARLDPALIAWVADMHGAGAHLYSACGGSLVLAAAGLLDGLEATTHWAYAALFKRAFPKVRVQEQRVLVQAGPGHRIVSSGGASSWHDLCLLIIARHAGSVEAIRISKLFLFQWHRDGQLPFASLIMNSDHRDSIVRSLQDWLTKNYRRHDVLAELARRSGLPKRTFDRRFKQCTGQAPLAYVQALRIEEAKHLLESTGKPVETVAAEVGYEDTRYFRGLFARLTAMKPGDYRRKFQIPPQQRSVFRGLPSANGRPVASGGVATRRGSARVT